MTAKNIKIFIASSAEVKAEREKAILMLNHLSKSHRHLQLEPVEWEYDIVPGSQPGSATVQHSINPKLQESDLLVFIFYSRIGQYTRQEFELATDENKKFFVFFKSGFSPANKTEHELYGELLDFKDGLNSTVLHIPYKDADGFGGLLYQSLNLYLGENYPGGEVIVIDKPMSAELSTLIRLLGQKEERIKELEGLLPTANGNDEVQKLTAEITAIKQHLAQSEELRQQQAADKAALEQQLSSQKENDQLKAQALEAVEKGDYAAAENLLQESAKDSIATTAATFYELAKLKKLQLQYRPAFEFYELAVRIAQDNSLYLHDAGEMAIELGYMDKAIGYFKKGLPLVISRYGEKHPEISNLYNYLGEAYNNKGEYDKAIRYYEKSLDIGKEFNGDWHPDIAIRYNNLGTAYNHKCEYDKAIEYYQQALSIDKEFYGEQHLAIAVRCNNLGAAYRGKNIYDKAIEYYEQALIIDKSVYGERHPDIAIDYNNLGAVYTYMGEYDRAICYFEQALNIGKEFYGERHPVIAIHYNNLGDSYRCKGMYGKAFDYFDQALNIEKEFYGERHPNIAIIYNSLGLSHHSEGGYEKAIGYYEKAIAIMKEFFEDSNQKVQTIKKNLQWAIEAKAKKG